MRGAAVCRRPQGGGIIAEHVYPTECNEGVYPEEHSEDFHPAEHSEDAVYPAEYSEDVYPTECNEDVVVVATPRANPTAYAPLGRQGGVCARGHARKPTQATMIYVCPLRTSYIGRFYFRGGSFIFARQFRRACTKVKK